MRTLTIKLSMTVFFAACQKPKTNNSDAADGCWQDCDDKVECTVDTFDQTSCTCLHEPNHLICAREYPGTICAPNDPSKFGSPPYCSTDKDCPALEENCVRGYCDQSKSRCHYDVTPKRQGCSDYYPEYCPLCGCQWPTDSCSPITEQEDCPALVDGCLQGYCDPETLTCSYLLDRDEDGHIPATCTNGDDCDDTRRNVHSEAGECLDGVDNDCDGLVDNTRDRFDCTISPVNAPSVPYQPIGFTAVWTGSEMVIWGGRSPAQCGDKQSVNTGGKYDPLADTWNATSIDEAPPARSNHAAVWTGSEMLIWGGRTRPEVFQCYDYTNTGGRYDPILDVWSPMAMVGAPSATGLLVAVWTGSEMVVWAGNEGTARGSAVEAGARYNPSTDTWLPVRTDDAPEGCGGDTIWPQTPAVWSGSEMIVWGCRDRSGGRYDPINNNWVPTAVFGAPSARNRYTAIWADDCDSASGKQGCMIVWGGENPKTEENLGTGAMYFPQSDQWRPVSNVDAPEERVWHTAIWTGSEMLIYGGCCSEYGIATGALNSGGRYSPISNRWEATPIHDKWTPLPLYRHTAVWTGSEMIVWGGWGSRYAP